jgi:hypothetical protein
MDEVEVAMRRALGLYGDAPRPGSDGDRPEPARHTDSVWQHRRRFVQDGEVPVTVVRRDASEPAIGRSGPAAGRLHQVEAALAAETARAQSTERALHEAQAEVRVLRTLVGDAALAKIEALAADRRYLQETASLRDLMRAHQPFGYPIAHEPATTVDTIPRDPTEVWEVLRVYGQIVDPATRKLVLEMMRSMVAARAREGQSVPSERVEAPVGEQPAVPPRQPDAPIAPTLADALEAARARGAAVTSHLFSDPDMLSTAGMAKFLGMSEEGIRQKRKRHEILGVAFARRGLRYPAWQIRPDRQLLPALSRLFEILGDDDWRIYRFLLQHHPEAGGERAVDALWHGKVAAVIGAAENIAAGAFA